jgi:hypothetical protein
MENSNAKPKGRRFMKGQTLAISMCALMLVSPALAGKKKHPNRAMIEKMEAVPCGAKERGLTGLGSVFASVGATHVDSDEKLCPQYMIRTDDMEYHVRPLDHKHPRLLPVGQEGEFKISKDVMEMRIPDGDHKSRKYQVVAMKPIDHSSIEGGDASAKHDTHKDYLDKPVRDQNTLRDPSAQPVEKATKNPVPPPTPPQ